MEPQNALLHDFFFRVFNVHFMACQDLSAHTSDCKLEGILTDLVLSRPMWRREGKLLQQLRTSPMRVPWKRRSFKSRCLILKELKRIRRRKIGHQDAIQSKWAKIWRCFGSSNSGLQKSDWFSAYRALPMARFFGLRTLLKNTIVMPSEGDHVDVKLPIKSSKNYRPSISRFFWKMVRTGPVTIYGQISRKNCKIFWAKLELFITILNLKSRVII